MTTVFIDGHGKCEVWKLPKMSSPKQRKYRYTPESFTHPAKMHVVLCRKIIKTYTELGEIVLDPMCGVSTTQIEAALLGRNAVGTDLESKFIKISKKNIKLLKKLRTLAPKGKVVVLKGDARKLSELLSRQADSIVFSPPFADKTIQKKFKSKAELDKFVEGQKWLIEHGRSKEAIKRFIEKSWRGYSDNKENIGNLPYGKRVDAIVTSPPFGESNQFRGGTQLKQRMMKGKPGPYSQNKRNIGNLSYGVDAVVFSPPFSEAEFDCKHGIKGKLSPNLRGRKVWEDKHKTKLRKDNIGRLKHGQIDAIVTSPPFAGTSGGKGKKSRTPINARYPGLFERCIGGNKGGISSDSKNIDNKPYGSVDAIITSPPFGVAQRGGGIAQRGYDGPKHGPTDLLGKRSYMPENVGESKGQISRLDYGSVDAIITSPPYVDAVHKRRKRGTGYHAEPHRRAKQSNLPNYSQDPANIGNLPHGQVDAIVTSPPYVPKDDRQVPWGHKHGALEEDDKKRGFGRTGGFRGSYGDDPSNIGNPRKYGEVDAIVTSPPYEEAMGKKHHSPRADKIAEEKSLSTTYTKRADVIITIPPYEGSLEGTSRHTKGGIPERDPKLGQTGFYRSGSVGNIGNLKSETYLSAMLQVYAECFKVLKSGGLMVLVIKDFIRNKKVVRLDLDTKRLCEAVGFWWVETKLFRLQGKSFWRVLYEQKHPEVDTSLLRYEFVEVFQKPLEACAGGDA